MSFAALLTGNACLIVGVEDDPDGSLRVYLGARWKGIHVHVDDETARAEIRRAWGDPLSAHVFTARPPADALCQCVLTDEETDPELLVGSDGLTAAERSEFADRYAAGPGAKPTAQEAARLRAADPDLFPDPRTTTEPPF